MVICHQTPYSCALQVTCKVRHIFTMISSFTCIYMHIHGFSMLAPILPYLIWQLDIIDSWLRILSILFMVILIKNNMLNALFMLFYHPMQTCLLHMIWSCNYVIIMQVHHPFINSKRSILMHHTSSSLAILFNFIHHRFQHKL